MRNPNPELRINPGGALTPSEVVGRDEFIASLWAALEHQSVLLTAERRMGKTSVLLKLEAEPAAGICVIKRTLQGIRSPDEFVRKFVADVEKASPGLLKRSLGDLLARAGIRKIGSSPLSVEFSPPDQKSWKDLVSETFAALDDGVDETVLLLWDELPQMIADIHEDHGASTAREMLDVMRAARETHPGVRMILSGSLGIHHVVAELRAEGGMWVPTHDMRAVDLPPLDLGDANYLALQLLRNEEIECDDVGAVADAIADEVDCIPYYVHQTAFQLRQRHRESGGAIGEAAAREVVAGAIADPLDPWELGHYLDRTPVYYGDDAELVNRTLDVVAREADPQLIDAIQNKLAAFGEPPTIERLRGVLDLLCKDYYLRTDPGYLFLRSLVRRAWLARRP